MSNLREITGDLLQLMVMLEDEPDSEILKDTLESVEGELDVKAENYVYIIKEYESRIQAIEAEIKRLTERKKTSENNINRLKSALQNTMEIIGIKKCGGDIYTVTLREGSLQLGDLVEEEIPKKYFIEVPATYKLDKKTLLADAKADKDKILPKKEIDEDENNTDKRFNSAINGVELRKRSSLLIK